MATEQVIEDHRMKIRNLAHELTMAIRSWHQYGRGDVIIFEEIKLDGMICDGLTVCFADETAVAARNPRT